MWERCSWTGSWSPSQSQAGCPTSQSLPTVAIRLRSFRNRFPLHLPFSFSLPSSVASPLSFPPFPPFPSLLSPFLALSPPCYTNAGSRTRQWYRPCGRLKESLIGRDQQRGSRALYKHLQTRPCLDLLSSMARLWMIISTSVIVWVRLRCLAWYWNQLKIAAPEVSA